jgi:tetratricopeptide (TPR) repeat protein
MSQRKLKKIRKEQVGLNPEKSSKEMVSGEKLDIKGIIKRNWKFLVAMSLVIFFIYVNGLNGAFVSDDYATILNNPDLTTWKYATTGGVTTYFVNSLLGRLFGVVPFSYHLFSVLLYIATFWLAFIFVEHIFGKWVAMTSMSIFGLHPIHVEAVSWISGKGYLLIAFYLLISMLALIKYMEKPKLSYLLISLLAFILNFLNDRPRPFSLFGVIVLYLIIKKIDIRRNRLFKYWPLIVLGIVGSILLAWPNIMFRIQTVNAGYNASDSIFYNPFFQYPTGLAKYFQLMLIPVDLTLYHTMYTFPVWLNWAILLNFLALLGYFFFKDKRYFFALSFIIVAILPSMAPVKVSWLVAERYAFLASLGFCLFLGLITVEVWKKIRIVSVIFMAILLVFFAERIYLRNVNWQTNHNLWVDTCYVSPNSHNAWNNIGDDYDKLKDYPNAIKGFTQSTVVKVNYADAYHNRANIFFKTGRLDLARASYDMALYYNPGLFQTYLSLTQIDLMEGNFNYALDHASKAAKLEPSNPQVLYVLGVVYAQGGDLATAKKIFEQILISFPDYKLAKDALGAVMSAST